MLHKQYHALSGVYSSWQFSLILLISLFVACPVQQRIEEDKIVQFEVTGRTLAHQLAGLYRENRELETQHQSRVPASADSMFAQGIIGQDPWGQAYSYSIEADEQGHLHVEMTRAVHPRLRISLKF